MYINNKMVSMEIIATPFEAYNFDRDDLKSGTSLTIIFLEPGSYSIELIDVATENNITSINVPSNEYGGAFHEVNFGKVTYTNLDTEVNSQLLIEGEFIIKKDSVSVKTLFVYDYQFSVTGDAYNSTYNEILSNNFTAFFHSKHSGSYKLYLENVTVYSYDSGRNLNLTSNDPRYIKLRYVSLSAGQIKGVIKWFINSSTARINGREAMSTNVVKQYGISDYKIEQAPNTVDDNTLYTLKLKNESTNYTTFNVSLINVDDSGFTTVQNVNPGITLDVSETPQLIARGEQGIITYTNQDDSNVTKTIIVNPVVDPLQVVGPTSVNDLQQYSLELINNKSTLVMIPVTITNVSNILYTFLEISNDNNNNIITITETPQLISRGEPGTIVYTEDGNSTVIHTITVNALVPLFQFLDAPSSVNDKTSYNFQLVNNSSMSAIFNVTSTNIKVGTVSNIQEMNASSSISVSETPELFVPGEQGTIVFTKNDDTSVTHTITVNALVPLFQFLDAPSSVNDKTSYNFQLVNNSSMSAIFNVTLTNIKEDTVSNIQEMNASSSISVSETPELIAPGEQGTIVFTKFDNPLVTHTITVKPTIPAFEFSNIPEKVKDNTEVSFNVKNNTNNASRFTITKTNSSANNLEQITVNPSESLDINDILTLNNKLISGKITISNGIVSKTIFIDIKKKPIIVNNKSTSLKGGMPLKFGIADNGSSFNNARKSFTKTELRTETYKESIKKSYGGSYIKDASSIIADKKKNAIGSSVNHLEQEVNFGGSKETEQSTAKQTLMRGSRYRF